MAETDPVLAEGTRVGDFELRGLLGEGAMGQVYLAEDKRLGRRVALKLIKRAIMQSDGVERFLLEARATASFNHPHIVTLYAVGEHEGRPYLALEYIKGESLRARLAAGPLPMHEALRCCRAVADAIAEAHRRGLVHADLKPENIVMPSDGRVRVVDFGLAKLALGAPGATSGTPAYMAPERWRGAPPTGAIDVWALGVTLHELITGRRPFPDAALLRVAFATDPVDLPDLPAAPWARLVRDCLALEPAARPTAEELVRRLTRLLDSHAATAGDDVRAMGAPEAHAQYLPTEHAVAETPAHHLSLAFSARNTGPSGDDWLATVVERLVRQILREHEDRRFEVDRIDDATWLDLTFVRDGDQFRVEARFRADEQLLASTTAVSVVGAARKLVVALEAKLGGRLAPVEPEPVELEAMRRIGATSAQLFRRYTNLVHAYFATLLPDADGMTAATRELVAADPAWAHPYALLAFLEGLGTRASHEVLALAQRTADAARDPSGMGLLRAFGLFGTGETEAVYGILDDVLRGNDGELLGCVVRTMTAVVVHRTEEAVAFERRLHVQHPELMFGFDLAEALRREGRDADAERAIREWAAQAPESLVARVALARLEASTGRLDEARARAHEVLEIHGEREDALPDLFEALAGTDQLSDARAIADRMLLGSPLTRARGRYRIAVTAVLEGRFAAAYDAVRRALTEHRTFGMQSELTQCLELARSIAPLVADLEAARRHTEELTEVFATMVGDAGTAAATRFELALLERRGAAPSIEEHLAGLEDGPQRDVARRRMLRAAAVADCGSAPRAVAAGFSAFEENTASLVALGLCAWRVRELDLARRSFERATQRWSSTTSNQSSPYHAILARFHLGGVLDELGDHAAARAAYEAFLRCWSDPDRPIPEVEIARRRLERDSLIEVR